jgi:hypothetical protein
VVVLGILAMGILRAAVHSMHNYSEEEDFVESEEQATVDFY